MKTIKQEVIVAETNSNDAVIVTGLNEGDKVYLSLPEGTNLEDDDFVLLKEMNGKRRKKEEKTDDKPAPATPAGDKVISATEK